MTRIDFHSNVGDSLLYACRLARKAYLAGQPTIVLAEPPAPARIRRAVVDLLATRLRAALLWPTAPLAAQTPIVLTANLDHVPHYQVLLNLGAEVPAQFARFERLLEVVGNAQDELVRGPRTLSLLSRSRLCSKQLQAGRLASPCRWALDTAVNRQGPRRVATRLRYIARFIDGAYSCPIRPILISTPRYRSSNEVLVPGNPDHRRPVRGARHRSDRRVTAAAVAGVRGR